MSISLYDASVSTYLQTLGAVSKFLEKGQAHCQAQGLTTADLVETRLAPDMLPLRFQIQSVAHHSLGAIEGIRSGVFRPPADLPALDYPGLQALMADTSAALHKLTPQEINALDGGDLFFEIRGTRMPFTAQSFLLSFSLPNFFFHAATAYDILRSKGVALGKRDFLGALRLKT